MADEMADMEDAMADRREYRTGSLYQRASDGRWMATIEAGLTADGKRRRITVTGKTEGEAKRKLRDKRAQVERDGRRQVKRTITVAAYANKWLAAIQPDVRPSSYDTDRAAVKWIIDAIGNVKLDDLTPEDVRAVAGKVRAAGNSSSSALRYQGSLTRMLKAAILDGYAVPPAVLLAKKPTRAVSDRRALPLDDAAKVLKHVATLEDGSRWALAFLQGLRQGEALGLTWDSVDLDARTITVSWQMQALPYRDKRDRSKGFRVPDGYEARQIKGSKHLVRPKSKKGWRVIPLTPWAANSLREWKEIAPEHPLGLVWPGNNGWPRNVAHDLAQWQDIQEALGVAHPAGRPYVVHEIRHATATVLMELGVPESVRLAIMGHSSIAVTQGYEYVDVEQARDALERAGARWALS